MVDVGTNGTITPPVEGLLRGAQRAEAAGYDSIWWPDHLMGFHPQAIWQPDVADFVRLMANPHTFLDPVAAIAATATHTERLRLGTAVTEAVRRHPAMLAQEFLTLDHLSRGRTILGIGAGESENIEPYGMDFSRPVSKLDEALSIVRLLWENDDPVDFEGEFWTLRDAVCGLGPYEIDEDGTRHYPPIWLGAHGPRMLELAGRTCDGWLPIYQGGVGRWRHGLAHILDAAIHRRRDVTAFTPGLLAHIVVHDDPPEVERLLETPLIRAWMLTLPSWAFEELGYRHPLGDGFYGLLDYVPTRLSRETAEAAIAKVPAEVARRFLLSGTPDEIVDELRGFVDAGLQHLVMWNLTYLADPATLRDSYELCGEIAATVKSWPSKGVPAPLSELGDSQTDAPIAGSAT